MEVEVLTKKECTDLMLVELTKSSKGSSDAVPADANPDFFCRFSWRILFLRCVENPSWFAVWKVFFFFMCVGFDGVDDGFHDGSPWFRRFFVV